MAEQDTRTLERSEALPGNAGVAPGRAASGRAAPRAGAIWLTVGGVASFAIAGLHLGMIPVGEPAYVFFTAPERMIALARIGSSLPAVITAGIAAAFAFFGVCSIAAGRLNERPALRILLVGITGIYLLRGALIVPESIVVRHAGYPPRMLGFSVVALLVGVVHLVGLARSWHRLGRPGE